MSVQQLMMHFQEESVPPGLKPYFTHGAYLPPITFLVRETTQRMQ